MPLFVMQLLHVTHELWNVTLFSVLPFLDQCINAIKIIVVKQFIINALLAEGCRSTVTISALFFTKYFDAMGSCLSPFRSRSSASSLSQLTDNFTRRSYSWREVQWTNPSCVFPPNTSATTFLKNLSDKFSSVFNLL